MIKISKAERSQAKEIVELLKYICAVHRKGRPDVFISDQPKYDESAVCGLMDDENTFVITASDDGRVVGYMIAELIDEKKHPHLCQIRTFYIDDICVAEDCARKGIGTMLFDEAKRMAKELSCERIDLNVWAFNKKAIKFYEKMGLTVSRMHMECKIR